MTRVAGILMWLLALVAAPAMAASSPSLTSLERQLAYMVDGRSGNYGIAALDLATGEMVSLRGDTAFPMASTMKIAVAANYLAQVEFGRRSLDDRIGGRSARALMEAMMIKSDNVATDLLLANLGGPAKLQQWLRERHVSGMRVDRTIAQLLAAKRDLWDVRDSATPRAMVELLRRIDKGELLRPSSRAYLLDLMARCKTGRNRMRALLPASAQVQHKTGTLNNYTSDVGFITLPDGRRLAVAFFARGGANRPATIAMAARTIYDGFARTFLAPVAAPFTRSFGTAATVGSN
ncbi:serine hydrolase [Sphingomonas mesophila]|uniref:serine hydrolase n=1 Tax=Sphingomonas mesophila TaxID=2303576 RepID=UPI001F072B73|nr:serine hydrolase [Sphingomonas mesophila]